MGLGGNQRKKNIKGGFKYFPDLRFQGGGRKRRGRFLKKHMNLKVKILKILNAKIQWH